MNVDLVLGAPTVELARLPFALLVRIDALPILSASLRRSIHDARNALQCTHMSASLLQEHLESSAPHGTLLEDVAELQGDLPRLDSSLVRVSASLRCDEREAEPVAAAALGEDALTLARLALTLRGNGRLALVVERDCEAVVNVDPLAIVQALFGLLRNAVEATEGSGRVELFVRADSDHVYLEVRDDGPGFRALDLDACFELGATTRTGHYGLGLTVARALVRDSGGRLEVDEPETGGVHAVVALPRCDSTSSA